MHRFLLFIGTFLLFVPVFAQTTADSEEFNALDSIVNQVKIVGAGESTHGTSKFTTIRLELFRYLVEKHHFNTFFLEADFSACQRVNRYINGQADSVEKALSEIVLWPWQTQEMIEIINWCKSYNAVNDKKISFVGCDMQLINDDYMEFSRMPGLTPENRPMIDSVFLNLNYRSSDSLIRIRKARWNECNKSLKQNIHFANHIKEIEMMEISINQWFTFQLENGRKYNFRDSCMASNMMKYLELNPGSKALYFAHNWHVSNTVYKYKKYPSTKTTGAFLKERMNNQYLCTGLVSSEFQFNAMSCKSGKYQICQFSLTADKRKDLERWLGSYSKKQLEMVYAKSIPKLNKYDITNIGASYGKDCTGIESASKIRLQKEMFDLFIYIRSSGATVLTE